MQVEAIVIVIMLYGVEKNQQPDANHIESKFKGQGPLKGQKPMPRK